MEMIDSLVVEQIKRFEVDFINSMTKVKILVNDQRIRLEDGTNLEPKLGALIELERWIADELVQSGLASPQDDVQLDRVAINRLRWLETSFSADSLRPLPPGFYPRARRLLLQAASKAELKNEIDSALKEVLNARIRKLLRFAIAPSLPQDARASLQPEEKLLYELIHGCVNSWKEGVLGAGWK
jgi:hypothetical protein